MGQKKKRQENKNVLWDEKKEKQGGKELEWVGREKRQFHLERKGGKLGTETLLFSIFLGKWEATALANGVGSRVEHKKAAATENGSLPSHLESSTVSLNKDRLSWPRF